MKTKSHKTTGTVTQLSKNSIFIELDKTKTEMLCYLNGKMMKHKIKLERGDRVEIEFSEQDLTKGRIIRRF